MVEQYSYDLVCVGSGPAGQRDAVISFAGSCNRFRYGLQLSHIGRMPKSRGARCFEQAQQLGRSALGGDQFQEPVLAASFGGRITRCRPAPLACCVTDRRKRPDARGT